MYVVVILFVLFPKSVFFLLHSGELNSFPTNYVLFSVTTTKTVTKAAEESSEDDSSDDSSDSDSAAAKPQTPAQVNHLNT